MKKNNLDFHKIRELHQSGQLDAAKVAYLNILRKNPRNVEVLHSLAILFAQQDNLTEAIDYLQRALKIQPDNPVFILHLSNMLKMQGLYSQAAQLLEEAINKNPDFIPALNNLGTVYYAQGSLDKAIHAYRIAITKKPDYVDAYYNLGLALTKQNNLVEAVDVYNKLLELSPEHFAARFHLACALMQTEKINDALKVFLEIETAHPYHFETQTNLATCFLKLGLLNEAKEHYLKALELKPEDIQILFNLGVIYMQQGNIDTAIQYYQRGVQINPDSFALHNNLGVAFIAKQHVGFALHHFREALRIQPNNVAISHTISVLSQNQHLLTSPPEYIKSLFDAYADHYEQHLLTALEYKVPELFLKAVLQITAPPQHAWDILDLGCGTGLCGMTFAPYAKTLIGVDLSAKMLEEAAKKNIYTELVEDDLSHFLSKTNSKYNLILAGDVLVYIGDLTKIFEEITSALKKNGLFVFNTEISNDDEFKMNQSGRFGHNENYLKKLIDLNHLKIMNHKTVITRMQNNEPVYGYLYVTTKL